MSVGEMAAIIAAVAFVALVALAALPLIKLNKTLDEVREAVSSVSAEAVPMLREVRSTVDATNEEIGRLGLVTEDLQKVSTDATAISQDAAYLSRLFSTTITGPLVKTAAFSHGVRAALRGRADS